MGFAEGVQAGKSLNPFDVILERVDKARERKRQDEKDLMELEKLFGLQKAKFEQDQALQREKQFFEQYEPSGIGEQGVNFQGTPFESVSGGKSFKQRNTQQPIVMVDPTTGEQRQVGFTQKGAKVIQEKPSPEQEIKTKVREKELTKAAELLPKLEQAETAVNMLKQQYYRGDTPVSVKKGKVFGGIRERGKGVAQGIVANLGGNAELKTYINNRKAFASLISKGGFLEAGMLTNQDIDRILNALPSSGSTKEEADAAWREVEGILGSARNKFESKLKEYGGGQSLSVEDDDNDPLGLRE